MFAETDPGYRLLRRMGGAISWNAYTVMLACLLALICWVPLALLSASEGLAVGTRVRIPFLYDFTAYCRFLVAVPLLVLSDLLVDPRLTRAQRHFVQADLVTEADTPAFNAAVEQANGMRSRMPAEILLLLLAYAGSLESINTWLANGVSSWRGAAGASWTPADWWYALVSTPIARFLLLRWIWRIIIWTRFLRRVSLLDLKLVPTHPDLAAGLGFLAIGQASFWEVVLAAGAIVAGACANRVVYMGYSPERLATLAGGFVLLAVVIVLCPLLILSPRLLRVKRDGLHDYGRLATQYVQSFDRKWLQGDNPEGENVLGTSDIQSLADLNNSFEIVRRMRVVPFGMTAVAAIAIAAVLPILPVWLATTPIDKILKAVLKILG